MAKIGPGAQKWDGESRQSPSQNRMKNASIPPSRLHLKQMTKGGRGWGEIVTGRTGASEQQEGERLREKESRDKQQRVNGGEREKEREPKRK